MGHNGYSGCWYGPKDHILTQLLFSFLFSQEHLLLPTTPPSNKHTELTESYGSCRETCLINPEISREVQEGTEIPQDGVGGVTMSPPE